MDGGVLTSLALFWLCGGDLGPGPSGLRSREKGAVCCDLPKGAGLCLSLSPPGEEISLLGSAQHRDAVRNAGRNQNFGPVPTSGQPGISVQASYLGARYSYLLVEL